MSSNAVCGRRKREVAVQSLRWLGALVLLVTFWLPLAGAPTAWADGELDSDFDADGKVTTDIAGSDRAQAVAIQSDGKIIAAGTSTPDGATFDFTLARYNPDGSLDSSFDTDGKVATDFGGNDVARAVAFQSDGKIIAAGNSSAGGNNDFALARYNPDGSLDSSFDTDGKVTTDLGGTDAAQAVAVRSDGKILAVGNSSAGGNNDFALAWYNLDGTLDTTFSFDGKVATDFGGSEQAFAVALQSDGKIVAAGYRHAGGRNDFALARYNPDGTLDSSFDTDGKVTTDLGGNDVAYAGALQSDGKFLAVGQSTVGGTLDFALARYNLDGSLDSSFDTDGKVITALGVTDQAFAGEIQSDGKILVAGYSNVSGSNDFALARYNSDGSLDSSFDTDGKVTTDFGGNDVARAGALQSDGKILAVGNSEVGSNNDFALARYRSPLPTPTSTATSTATATAMNTPTATGTATATPTLTAVHQAFLPMVLKQSHSGW